MVSTRNHPSSFPEPTLSPSKQRSVTPTLHADNTPSLQPRTPSRTTRRATSSSEDSSMPSTWSHTPSNLLLIWLAVSLPLVIWDTGYVMGRPHTFPGGALYWPLYVPYKLYDTVDYVYSVRAYNDRYGFTGAQGMMNVFETLGYLVYLWIVWTHGEEENEQGAGAPSANKVGFFGLARTVRGRWAGIACLLALSTTVMTCSKTVLYWLVEVFSGFKGVRHNDWMSLIFLWIIPNLPWIVLPGYLAYVFAKEILEGLNAATGETKKSR